ncbi:hypothetical protein PFICI_08372 [Pestalotiopsis fici W106-1]|uniref:Spherulin-4 n=1 Tax=Pestalotiopsis fici (strain W106-1 / CGMCC3.15140) TaxID=1229662 RepID=W3X3Y3_PESFW|nr:uncharacterized protein PFICI_08372 [Pestalotiopsis fici W106-1]ETS80843.1 hypothetical protein PFICI_08372 [Pestalotiopsis fici W106-1]
MRAFAALGVVLAAAHAAHAKTGIILPLYEYPYGDAALADWDSTIAAVSAHPNLDFYIIMNDNSGPPYDPNPPNSNRDFAPYLGSLNSHANVKLIGYIATKYSGKSISDVTAAVDQYAAWETGKGWKDDSYDIHISGIFFDEINTAPDQLSHNLEITRYAKAKFAGLGGPIVLNPGTFVQNGSESLFDVADAIMDIEACYTGVPGRIDFNGYACDPSVSGYSAFTPALLDGLGTDQSRVSKSSILVHDFYDSWSPYQPASESKLKDYVDAIVSKGVHSFYIAQFGYIGNFTLAPASIGNIAGMAASAQGLS